MTTKRKKTRTVERRYRGKEFKMTIGAPSRVDLEDLIFAAQECAGDSGMGSFEVIDVREDPDGGYEAIVVAHNFNPFKWVKEKAKEVGGKVKTGWQKRRAASKAKSAEKKIEREAYAAAEREGQMRFAASGGKARAEARERELEKRRRVKTARPGKAKPHGKVIGRSMQEMREMFVGRPSMSLYVPRTGERYEMIPAGRAIGNISLEKLREEGSLRRKTKEEEV